MAEIQLEKADVGSYIYRVKNPSTKDPKVRSNVATSLRAKAKRESPPWWVATRGDDVFVGSQESEKNLLPKIAGRGQPGPSLSELAKAAK